MAGAWLERGCCGGGQSKSRKKIGGGGPLGLHSFEALKQGRDTSSAYLQLSDRSGLGGGGERN